MTIDKRLERLTERVEAIAQSIELLSTLHADNERVTRQGFETLTSLHADTERQIAQLTATMNRLGNIIIGHEQRIEDLERRP
jgi:NCAIR mutase (PurE)-related protein